MDVTTTPPVKRVVAGATAAPDGSSSDTSSGGAAARNGGHHHRRSSSLGGENHPFFEYFGWVYHLGVNTIGHEYCHLRFLFIKGKYMEMYKRDPHENPGIKPIRKGVIGHTLMIEEEGRQKVNHGDIYVIRFYNRLDETKKGQIACATAGEARKWMEAFDHAKQQAEYEISRGVSARNKLNMETEIDLEAHRPRVRRYASGLKRLIKIGQGPESLLRQSSDLGGSVRDGYIEGDVGDAVEAHQWKCVRTVNGVRIFEDVSDSKSGRGRGVLVKSVGVVDASSDTVFEVILNLDRHRRYEWDMLTGDLELVDSYDGHYDVVYGTYDPKYLTRWQSKRDFVFSRQWFCGQDGTYTILQIPAIHKKRPPRNGYRRTKISPSTWEVRSLNMPMGSSGAKCLVTQMLEIHSSGWCRWKKNSSSKFEKTIHYALLSQVSSLKEYIGANPALKVESSTMVVQSKHSNASSSSGDYEDIDVQDQFYDAIAAASSSSEDEDSDDDGELDKKDMKVKLKNVSWAITSLALKRTSGQDANKELDSSVAPITIDPSQFHGSMQQERDGIDSNCWSSPSGKGFMIRGKTYLKDNAKRFEAAASRRIRPPRRENALVRPHQQMKFNRPPPPYEAAEYTPNHVNSGASVMTWLQRLLLLHDRSTTASSLLHSGDIDDCFSSLMSSRKDPAWKYGVEVETDEQKGYKYIQCKFCDRVLKGGVFRMKEHLAGVQGNVAPCTKVTLEVREEIKTYILKNESAKKRAQLMREERIDNCVTLNSLSKKGSSSGSVTERGIRGPMDRFVVNVENDTVEDLGGNDRGVKGLEKEARENTCLDIAEFFYENGLVFNVASSPSFVKMLRSAGSYGRGLKPPTAHELSTSLLSKVEGNTQAIVEEVKKTWSKTGVSIMSDGWKDIRGRQLINFLVNNPHGTVFLKSIDASDVIKDARLLFNLLDSVVEEVGENLVVQVVTDNASNYKKAGEMLMQKRTRLWWTPCATHCIDLILEKIGSLPQHQNALKKAKKAQDHFDIVLELDMPRDGSGPVPVMGAGAAESCRMLSIPNNSKIIGGDPLLKLIAVDWLKADKAADRISLHPKCLVQSDAGKKLPFILVFNLQVPAKPNYNLVLYYACSRPVNKDSLLGKFVDGTDAYRDSRFKLIPSIVEGYWMVKRAVGTKACLLGKAVTCRYLRQDNFLEIDVDIGSSSVARSVIGLVLGYVTSLVVDLGILIEAKEEGELPEYVLGTVQLNCIRLDSAVALEVVQGSA
ncbi:hypothetical protein Q3G72_033554 [Acer saccharum]|nr:hypothetical protein Q3G72_033554 [Acer saccharum]